MQVCLRRSRRISSFRCPAVRMTAIHLYTNRAIGSPPPSLSTGLLPHPPVLLPRPTTETPKAGTKEMSSRRTASGTRIQWTRSASLDMQLWTVSAAPRCPNPFPRPITTKAAQHRHLPSLPPSIFQHSIPHTPHQPFSCFFPTPAFPTLPSLQTLQ